MTDDMLGPSPMHTKYSSYVYDGFGPSRTNFPGPIESVISKFTCIHIHSVCVCVRSCTLSELYAYSPVVNGFDAFIWRPDKDGAWHTIS